MTDLMGPANALNAVTARPPESRVFGSADTFFKDCSSALAKDGTALTSSFFNGVLQQLRRAIRGQSVGEDNADDDMLLKAIRSSGIRWGTASGTATDLVLAASPTVASVYAGLAVAVKLSADSTGPLTLKVDGTDVKNVTWSDGSAVSAGDLKIGGVMFVIYDGAKYQIVNYRPPATQFVPFAYKGGLETTWIDGTHISIAPGAAASSDGAALIVIPSAVTKDVSAPWAAGVGGMRSANAYVDGTWHVFVIADTTGAKAPDILADTSLVPAMPTGYNKYRRICSLVVSGGTIRRYAQLGNHFWWYDATIYDYQVSNYTFGNISPTLVALSVPTGLVLEAHCTAYLTAIGNSAARMTVWPPQLKVPTLIGSSWFMPGIIASSAYSGDTVDDFDVMTDTSGQIRLAINSTASLGFGAILHVKGYSDNL